MKISILGGAGVVGSTSAYRIAQGGTASEIVLFDVRHRLAEAHAFDIDQSVVYRAATRVRAGGIADCANSDVIVLAAPQHDANVTKPGHFASHASRVLEVVEPLVAKSPSAFWIITTNPVDALVYLIHRELSLPRNKVIGLNRNDSARFRWAVAKVLSVPSTAVEAITLGEHGKTQVPLFSSIRVNGKPFPLSRKQIDAIRDEATSFLIRWTELNPGRTAGWATGESVGDIVSTMALDDGRAVPCSMSLEGEYGLRDVSLGVPVKLGQTRVKEVVELPLAPWEQKGLESSAEAIRAMIEAFRDHE